MLAVIAAERKVFVGYAVLMLLFACSCSGAAKLVALQRGLAARVQRGRFEEPGETLKCLRHHTVHPEETSGKMSGLTTLCWESSFTSWLLSTRHPCWRQLPEARRVQLAA